VLTDNDAEEWYCWEWDHDIQVTLNGKILTANQIPPDSKALAAISFQRTQITRSYALSRTYIKRHCLLIDVDPK